MNQKKILFLGGSFSQIPAIEYAKVQGYYVITADNLPDNPGHQIADEYHKISTINKEEILILAEQLQIDAICAYASDPAAPTAAYVSDKLNLIGSPYKSVEILSNKNLFREFLKENGFITPWYIYGSNINDIEKLYNGDKAILKPIDSSGSKGIFTINNKKELRRQFETAKGFSRSGTIILEEYIERKGPQIHGEGFVVNGEVIFILLGDQVFSTVNNLIPYSTIVPSLFHTVIIEEINKVVKSVIKKVGFKTGGVNIEVIRDYDDKIYILEIGARNGGNFMPQLMKHATGFDIVKANIDALLNKQTSIFYTGTINKHYAQIILHSKMNGIFRQINIPKEFKDKIKEQCIYYKEGNKVRQYKSSKDVVGVIIFELNDEDDIKTYRKSIVENNWVKVD